MHPESPCKPYTLPLVPILRSTFWNSMHVLLMKMSLYPQILAETRDWEVSCFGKSAGLVEDLSIKYEHKFDGRYCSWWIPNGMSLAFIYKYIVLCYGIKKFL